MKYLIIPDVHNRTELAEKIIEKVNPDLTIFLGDYFDDFGDDPHIIRGVARWFKESVNKPKRIHLCGNHDVHYWFKDNSKTRCSGYGNFKSMAINDIVTKNDWEKLKFFHVLDGKWLLSHAGIHPSFIVDSFKASKIHSVKLTDVVEKLKHDSIEAMKNLYAGKDHWFIYAGFSRSMTSRGYGGLLWCDWNQEFMPMKGIHQIVGHTPQRNVKWVSVMEDAEKYDVFELDNSVMTIEAGNTQVLDPRRILTDKSSYNLCLDTHPGSQYYAIYENGTLTIHESSDLK